MRAFLLARPRQERRRLPSRFEWSGAGHSGRRVFDGSIGLDKPTFEIVGCTLRAFEIQGLYANITRDAFS